MEGVGFVRAGNIGPVIWGSVTHRCILVFFFGVSQTIQLLNKIINMLIPAFSNKITNITSKTRLRRLLIRQLVQEGG